jgi:hypothetical protein
MLTSSRSPSSAERITGALWPGKIAGSGSNAVARLCGTSNRSRMALTLVVRLYKLHIVKPLAGPIEHLAICNHAQSGHQMLNLRGQQHIVCRAWQCEYYRAGIPSSQPTHAAMLFSPKLCRVCPL